MAFTTIKVNESVVLKRVKQKVLEKMVRASKSFPRAGTLILQKAFETFGKNPIDTSLSQKSSKVTSFVDLGAEVLNINLTIPTPYSPFFRFGWGSNKTIGPRDPIKKAIPTIINSIIKQIT